MKEIKLDFGNGRVEHIKLQELPIEELKSTKNGTWIMISKPPEYGLNIVALGKFSQYCSDSGYLSLYCEQEDKKINGVEYCYSERFKPIGETFWREVL